MTSHSRPEYRMWWGQGWTCDKGLAGDQNPEPQSLEDKEFGFCLWGLKPWKIRMQGVGEKRERGGEEKEREKQRRRKGSQQER